MCLFFYIYLASSQSFFERLVFSLGFISAHRPQNSNRDAFLAILAHAFNMNLRTEANFCRQEKEEENYKRTLREIIYAKEKKNIYGDVK